MNFENKAGISFSNLKVNGTASVVNRRRKYQGQWSHLLERTKGGIVSPLEAVKCCVSSAGARSRSMTGNWSSGLAEDKRLATCH